MDDTQLKLIIGGLLHDVGKVLYRASDGRNYSQNGFDYMKNELKIEDTDILEQVYFHHASNLKNAKINDNSLAYITYTADNISASADRRKSEDGIYGFQKDMALESVFNILNGNDEKKVYSPAMLQRDGKIQFPLAEKKAFDEGFYRSIEQKMSETLKALEYKDSYVNSLLEVLEAIWTYIPSSTSKGEKADISLFDHSKLTAAIGSCIYLYLSENDTMNYKDKLFINGKKFYEEPVFLIMSMDISGIQEFIYNIPSKDALKNLRSRSFFLEIFLENTIDELFDSLGLSRANLVYSGGGHAYVLLPNCEKVQVKLKTFEKRTNQWLLEHFQTALYMGFSWTVCSANELKNEPDGSYRLIFSRLSEGMSHKKMHRYLAEDIMEINANQDFDGKRECRICHRSDHLIKDDLCDSCNGMLALSNRIMNKKFFTVQSKKCIEEAVSLGPDRYLITDSEERLRHRIKSEDTYIRAYAKNEMYMGDSVATKLWVGDYKSADTFHELVTSGEGIRRLGVLRADVDNLGQAFVSGFENNKNKDYYVTLSRSATFSRKLSLFFKLHINDILENGEFSLTGAKVTKRNAAIIYSGGDDVFVVGAWKDILEFSVDLYHKLREFSQSTLTISAGFGMFPEKYPLSYIAAQTGHLEKCAKGITDGEKNAIALFDQENIYHWSTLIEEVIGSKFQMIYTFFSESQDRGKSFLYNLLSLFRNNDEKINLARLAYTLARMEPDAKADKIRKEIYKKFSKKIYEWRLEETDRKQVITAIYLYAYLIREEEKES